MENNLKYIYIYNWISLLYIWNSHKIVNQLFFCFLNYTYIFKKFNILIIVSEIPLLSIYLRYLKMYVL